MSIKIEVTADTTAELLETLRSLTAGLSGAAVSYTPAVVTETRGAPEGKLERSRPKAAAVAQETEVRTAPASEQIVEQPATKPVASASGKALDYDRDVAPKVIAAVKAKGREGIVSVLDQFGGVAKAADIPAEQWPEFLAALTDLPDLVPA